MSQCRGSSLAAHNVMSNSIRENASSVNPGQTGGRGVPAYCQGPVPSSLSGRYALAEITDYPAATWAALRLRVDIEKTATKHLQKSSISQNIPRSQKSSQPLPCIDVKI